MTATVFIDLLAVVFDIGLLTLYFHIFLTRRPYAKAKVAVIYLTAIAIYFCSSAYLVESWQRTLAYLGVCLLLSICYQGAITHKLVLTLLYVSIGVIIETVAAFVLTILDVNFHLIVKGSIQDYIIGNTVSIFIFFIILLGIGSILKNKLPKSINTTHLTESYWDLLFFVLLIITVIISYGINYLTIKQGIEHGLIFFLLLECLLIVFDIVIFFIFKEMEHLQQGKMHTALLKQQNKAQETFYKESIEKNRQLKKMIHDEKNFLLGLRGLLQAQQPEAAISEIEKKVTQLESNITDYTGILALDTILTAKAEQAAQNDILLRPAAAIYGKLYIDLMDLVLLLGNALDNAIEATKQVVNRKKVIHLNMKIQDIFLLLEVRNPVDKMIPIQNNWIVTSKEDSILHGFGLDNMKQIAEKYNGTLSLQCSDNFFVLKILLKNERD